MKKRILFKIIAISLPFFLLALIEMLLRISGYGESYPLFHKVTVENRPDYLVMNPYISRKYFKNQEYTSDNQFDLFLKTKTDSSFRIFVQGASTVVGFPYYRSGSFPRMLKHRLSQTFPEKNIEVVNTGLTAVNSYTLWDLTDDIIKQRPDLVIIYAGHNEYYGALGVGSSDAFGNRPGFVRTYLFFKNFRFFQALENGYSMISGSNDHKPGIGETTLMEVMVRERRIPFGSKVYQAGIEQFRSNLEKILNKYRKHDIPVILSTLVCNEKDIAPFISDSIENRNQFIEAVAHQSPEATQLAQKNARAAYSMGQYYLRHDQDTARKYLRLAKELDLLRFRAPEEINKTIAELSEKYEFPLVDMEDVFLAHSPQKVIGDELMTEHVHPNVKGAFIMADAFYNKIKELSFIGDWNNYIAFGEAFQDIPVTEIDSLKGKLVIDDLKKSWPFDLRMSGSRVATQYFNENSTYEQRRALDLYTNLATWRDVMVQSYERYDREGAYEKGLRAAQSLILEYPEEPKVYRMAGEMCLKLNDPEKAVYYYFKLNQVESSGLSARELASVYRSLSKIDQAYTTLLEAKNKGVVDEKLEVMIRKISGQLSKKGEQTQ